MIRYVFLCLSAALMIVSTQSMAASSVNVGCKRLQLAFDPKISPSVVEQDWGSGAPHDEAPATLELIGCTGEILDRAALASPLARIDPVSLRGAPALTYLVSADLTQIAGSYNGPLTILFQINGNRLQQVDAEEGSGRSSPIRLALTGKSAWKRVSLPKEDIILSVNSEPAKTGFVTIYKDYIPSKDGWIMHERSEAGLWESDGDFPDPQKFPDQK